MAAKNVNDRKRAEVKARKDSFINGNRKERRAAAFASRVAVPVVTNELKAKAKAKKVKASEPMDHVAEDLRNAGM